ncbi:hypothetical protein GOBAR_AA20154 [Gossypium barbadense]|uniref:RNA polymerase II C-terminal domain phosphatase-like n=1 Tax=Gossypium barbadense TaxID=3634 RepID=A0A2P5XB06_GOSBA|nr:hypothetical protein GOBAR_AA20154 [Gossypium barbadense]
MSFMSPMSFATDSPVHSSSSDDFAALIDAELEVGSSGSSPDEQDNEEEEVDADSDNDDGDDEEDDSNDDLNDHRNKRCKTEKLDDLEGPQGSTSQGLIEEKLEVSLNKDTCSHPGSFGQMCILCGQRVDDESSVTFGYIHKELDSDLASRDVRQRKLQHCCYMLIRLMYPYFGFGKSAKMMTKLRPFVRTFLKEASEMFEMYIYTMGDRPYALEMAKLLDPKKEYFNGRVISRDDGTQKHQKGLDVVLGQDSAVVILDDTENAWTKHKDNLILMERYHFFASSCRQFGFDCKSLSQLKSDESEPDGALASILKILRQIHHIFFDVLKTVRKEVLKNCKIVFSRVFPTKFQPENHLLWKMAEQLGATCSTETDSSVTHIVSMDAGTEKSRWAVKENKFLVHPRWIEAANFFWQKQPEENFPVSQTKNQ